MNNAQDQTRIRSTTGATAEPQAPERNASVDSAAFFEGDDYDDYDDFAAGGNGGGGGKVNKRSNERGGGGSGTIYSAKHIRAKEALQSSTAGRHNKTTSTSKK